MVNKKGEILYKSKQHKKGKNHDYTVYKDEHPLTPSQVKNYLTLDIKEQKMTFQM